MEKALVGGSLGQVWKNASAFFKSGGGDGEEKGESASSQGNTFIPFSSSRGLRFRVQNLGFNGGDMMRGEACIKLTCMR